MMMHSIKVIHWEDYCRSIPAFLTIILMPLAYSISDGIAFGIISYTILKVLTGKYKDVNVLLYVLSILFILKYFLI